MKKICFVIQRYGKEVNGGAEQHCRQFAEHMTSWSDVTGLTTRAVDYISWKNEYTSDREEINGVHVIRFSVDAERNIDTFNEINGRYLSGAAIDEREWIDRQGPLTPSLLAYISEHRDDYDVFIFYTYLYYQTVLGVPLVPEKALVVPTAHDEPPIRMKIFRPVFEAPRAIFYLTQDEKAFVETHFKVKDKITDIGGVGIEIPEETDPEGFRKKYGLDRYILYAGRIDEAKGCPVMFRYFMEYKKRNPGTLKLVLMGKEVIPVPEHPDIISLGFVSEEDKYNGMAGADFLLLPSQFESLSMVVLEAMAVRTPVLVNGLCNVLKSHCRNSNAGLWYTDYFEFEGSTNYLCKKEEERLQMGKNGRKYVRENYTWEIMEQKFCRLINSF